MSAQQQLQALQNQQQLQGLQNMINSHQQRVLMHQIELQRVIALNMDNETLIEYVISKMWREGGGFEAQLQEDETNCVRECFNNAIDAGLDVLKYFELPPYDGVATVYSYISILGEADINGVEMPIYMRQYIQYFRPYFSLIWQTHLADCCGPFEDFMRDTHGETQ